MASSTIDSNDMNKIVDEFYFPLTGLPSMSVFEGAWRYIGDDGESAIPMGIVSSSRTNRANQSNHQQNVMNDGVSAAPKKKSLSPRNSVQECAFCKNNGEPEHVWKSHKLKDRRKNVQCPRLREYKCEICGASGDNAHTLLHCPKRERLIIVNREYK